MKRGLAAPIEATGGPVKFGLLTVSYAGLFYDGPALSVVEQVRKARAMSEEATLQCFLPRLDSDFRGHL